MKKVLVLLMILALGFGAGGATCKSFWSNAQDKVCNAPPQVIEAANMAIELAKIVIAAAVPGTAPYIAAVGAYATATGIQSTGCAMITDLNKLIAFLESPDAQFAEKQLKLKKGPMKARAVNVQPFKDWAGIK